MDEVEGQHCELCLAMRIGGATFLSDMYTITFRAFINDRIIGFNFKGGRQIFTSAAAAAAATLRSHTCCAFSSIVAVWCTFRLQRLTWEAREFQFQSDLISVILKLD